MASERSSEASTEEDMNPTVKRMIPTAEQWNSVVKARVTEFLGHSRPHTFKELAPAVARIMQLLNYLLKCNRDDDEQRAKMWAPYYIRTIIVELLLWNKHPSDRRMLDFGNEVSQSMPSATAILIAASLLRTTTIKQKTHCDTFRNSVYAACKRYIWGEPGKRCGNTHEKEKSVLRLPRIAMDFTTHGETQMLDLVQSSSLSPMRPDEQQEVIAEYRTAQREVSSAREWVGATVLGFSTLIGRSQTEPVQYDVDATHLQQRVELQEEELTARKTAAMEEDRIWSTILLASGTSKNKYSALVNARVQSEVEETRAARGNFLRQESPAPHDPESGKTAMRMQMPALETAKQTPVAQQKPSTKSKPPLNPRKQAALPDVSVIVESFVDSSDDENARPPEKKGSDQGRQATQLLSKENTERWARDIELQQLNATKTQQRSAPERRTVDFETQQVGRQRVAAAESDDDTQFCEDLAKQRQLKLQAIREARRENRRAEHEKEMIDLEAKLAAERKRSAKREMPAPLHEALSEDEVFDRESRISSTTRMAQMFQWEAPDTDDLTAEQIKQAVIQPEKDADPIKIRRHMAMLANHLAVSDGAIGDDIFSVGKVDCKIFFPGMFPMTPERLKKDWEKYLSSIGINLQNETKGAYGTIVDGLKALYKNYALFRELDTVIQCDAGHSIDYQKAYSMVIDMRADVINITFQIVSTLCKKQLNDVRPSVKDAINAAWSKMRQCQTRPSSTTYSRVQFDEIIAAQVKHFGGRDVGATTSDRSTASEEDWGNACASKYQGYHTKHCSWFAANKKALTDAKIPFPPAPPALQPRRGSRRK